MAMVKCPECGGDVSDRALMCPHCGYASAGRGAYGYEFKSRTRVFGMPLVHIAFGFDIATGRPRVAKGFFAVGNIAVGVFALGGLAIGGVSLGGLAAGLLAALGGCAVGGLLAVGGLAVAIGVAIGGGAIGYYVLGGGALGAHALGGNHQDPEAIEFFKRWLGDWVEQVRQSGDR